jgi:farnesyl diphosphate synthase
VDINKLKATGRERVENALDNWIPAKEVLPGQLHDAMRYAVFNGGKRMRPILTYATGYALRVPFERLDGPACAVELIHAYSLVHDDLPSMDDDDLRRGKPTCHIAFDEATAVLAGDALQTLAFEILSRDESMIANPNARLRMISALAEASGSRGMVGGQAIDLACVGKDLNLAELENMHIHKTGALIHASVKLAALSCDSAASSHIERLEHFAKCLGLAFQIQDDVLDVESDTDTLGKTQGADQARNKPTYPSIVGLSRSKEMAREWVDHALTSLQDFDHHADPLRDLAQYAIERKH